ncbi:TetR/AcrR family transcriptional regulator [Nocardia sp. NRRL S-836]|uniref:TetR/AcrR family transcriptional regulator n=1 Tax=Nocardia sp. NRRL S-836 TaxID=1519492 RepID=UPI0006ADEEDB|nr:TetR/AcrR family transcriptional regulator [Nocardia sp. NRRL S-836]KOV88865.1 TetR family transcriptional regulator [Nocardia sp. NRRL S-836]
MARPRSFDEAQVLRAARERFATTGYAATSIDEVAAATGLGKGSLYGAFGDKHQLYLRVFDGYCTDVSEQVEQALAGPDSEAFERLSAHVHAVAASTAADVERRGCLLARGTAELSGQDPAVAARALRTFEFLEDLFVACLEKAQRHGDIDPDADPRALAGLLLAALRGIEALGKAGKSAASLHGIAETALALLPRPVAAGRAG